MKWTSFTAAFILLSSLTVISGCDRFTSSETRISRAGSHLEAGEYQAALVDLRKVLDAQPKNIDAQLLLIDVLRASGDLQAARVQLERAIENGAEPSDTDERQIEILLSQGLTEAVRARLQTSAYVSPASRAYFEGRLQFVERRLSEAQRSFEAALAFDPKHIDSQVFRIETLAAQNQLTTAAAAVDSLLRASPMSARLWLTKGLVAARSGAFTEASEAFSRAVEHRSGLTREQLIQAHAARVESQLTLNEIEAAAESVTAMEPVARDMPIFLLMRARVALVQGMATEAVNDLRRFSRAAPQHMAGRLLLVAALQEQGSLEQALAEALRCVSEFSTADEPRVALANVQLRMGRIADAEDTLQPLISKLPANPAAMAMLADILVRNGNAEAGIAMLEQTVAENPGDGRAILQLAGAHLAGGNAQAALSAIENLREPSLAAARDRLRVIAMTASEAPESAANALREAIQRHPEDIDLMLTAAAYAATSGHLEEARTHLDRALAAKPDDPAILQMLARVELSAGRQVHAREFAQLAVEKSPGDASAMVLMASIAAQAGEEEEVDAWLHRARAASPGSLDVTLAMARRAATRGDGATARSILAESVQSTPNSVGLRVALAELIASQGAHSEALQQLEASARQYPEAAIIPLTMAKVHIAKGDSPSGRRALQDALRLHPGWLPAASLLASLEVQQGNLSRALSVAESARKANPNSVTANLLTGDIYLAADRVSHAATAYADAYSRHPNSVAAIKALQARLRVKSEAPDTELRDWLTRTPADSDARQVLAEYLLQAGQYQAASSELEKVTQSRPTDAISLNNLAWLYQQTGDDRALTIARKAFELAPKHGAVADTYGWILVEAGKASDAIPILKVAVEAVPTSAQFRLHYATALLHGGEPDLARKELRQIIDQHPQSREAHDAEGLLDVTK